jgi:hypothetical protein
MPNRQHILTFANIIIISILSVVLSTCAPNHDFQTKQKPTATNNVNFTPGSILPSKDSVTKTPQYTKTVDQSQSLTPSSPSIATPTPGPHLSFLYEEEGVIHLFNFSTWSTDIWKMNISGKVIEATLSSDARWIAFRDEDGVKISERPYQISKVIARTSISLSNTLLFSHDNRWLAYVDDKGLNIYNLINNERIQVQKHIILSSEDGSGNRYYSPVSWSPDDQWLVVLISAWEWQSHVLFNLATRMSHAFTNCYSDVAWSPGKLELAVSVTYSGIQGCGEKDGLYVVTVSANRVAENQLYNPGPTNEPWLRSTHDVGWDTSGKWIYFVQEMNIDSPGYQSQLLWVPPDGGTVQELLQTRDQIISPRFDSVHNRILYISYSKETRENTVTAIDVATKKATQLGSIRGEVRLETISPDGNWLIFKVGDGLAILGVQNHLWIDPSFYNRTNIQRSSFIGWID